MSLTRAATRFSWSGSSTVARKKPQKKSQYKHAASGLTVRKAKLKDVQPFKWLWSQRVLTGYINLLVGEEGIGKGNLAAWILARVTKGELPGSLKGKPRNVAIVGDEDDFHNVWVPRLHKAGADLKRVEFIEAAPDGTIDLTRDTGRLQKYIISRRLALVYFDQLLDNVGATDTWKDKEVRHALAPLRKTMGDTDCAALATLHPNKRKGSFRERISGTPAFNALSRSSLFVGPHLHEPGWVALVKGKGNYTGEPDSFEFRIEEHKLHLRKRTITTSAIADWRFGYLTKDDVLDAYDRTRSSDRNQSGKARRLLSEIFSDRKPHPAAPIKEELEEKHGLSERTVSRAAADLGLKRWQKGFPGEWYWQASESGEEESDEV